MSFEYATLEIKREYYDSYKHPLTKESDPGSPAAKSEEYKEKRNGRRRRTREETRRNEILENDLGEC